MNRPHPSLANGIEDGTPCSPMNAKLNVPGLDDALALVAVGPIKTQEWMKLVEPMCRHCHTNEDVDQAAARILAEEIQRLRVSITELLYMVRTGATKEQLEYRIWSMVSPEKTS